MDVASITNMPYEDFIAHYGKPRRSGRFKWGSGLRPFQSLGLRGGRKKNSTSKTKAEDETPKKKKVSEMTDEEIQNRVSRLKLEQSLADLEKSMTAAPSKKKHAVDWISKIGKNVLDKSLENIGTQAVTYALGTAINKAIGQDIVNPKKGQSDKK